MSNVAVFSLGCVFVVIGMLYISGSMYHMGKESTEDFYQNERNQRHEAVGTETRER